MLRGSWAGLHSVAAPAALECGGKRSATPLWLALRGVRAKSKRRRRCALPAHSKGHACRLVGGLLCNEMELSSEAARSVRLLLSGAAFFHDLWRGAAGFSV